MSVPMQMLSLTLTLFVLLWLAHKTTDIAKIVGLTD